MKFSPENFGVSLKREHLRHFLQKAPPWGWFEVIAENLLSYSEKELADFEKLRQDYRLSLHITCGDIGGIDPLNEQHLRRIKALIDRMEPELVSDHLSFCRAEQVYYHDLLPIPYTPSYLQHTLPRLQKVQDIFGRRILLENISQYTRYTTDTISELEFLKQLTQQSGCGLLFDVNNLYVNQQNLGWQCDDYIQGLDQVDEIHIAGHRRRGDLLIDTHDGPASPEVLDLLQRFLTQKRHDLVPPIILEWDQDLPDVDELGLAARTMFQEITLRGLR